MNKKNNTTDIQKRINRASGQVSALSKMIDENRDCKDVITQFQAAKRALEGAYAEYLEEQLSTCLKKKDPKVLHSVITSIAKK